MVNLKARNTYMILSYSRTKYCFITFLGLSVANYYGFTTTYKHYNKSLKTRTNLNFLAIFLEVNFSVCSIHT